MAVAFALRVLIVDDEAPARARLRTLLGECTAPAARVVGEAADAAQARAWLAHGHCDLVLLDIALPGQSGLVLAADVRAAPAAGPAAAQAAARPSVPAATLGGPAAPAALRTPPAIVFVTAHADHAVLAFELDAVDYLTKPVRRERLQAALHRVAQRAAAAPAAAAPGAAQPDAPPSAGASGDVAADGVIVVHDRGRIHRVPVPEVIYLRAELKYLTLRTRVARHVLDGALGDFEQRLGDGFLRIHRNALVARRAVRALERVAPSGEPAVGADAADGWSVLLAGIDDRLPVSRRQLPTVRAALAVPR